MRQRSEDYSFFLEKPRHKLWWLKNAIWTHLSLTSMALFLKTQFNIKEDIFILGYCLLVLKLWSISWYKNSEKAYFCVSCFVSMEPYIFSLAFKNKYVLCKRKKRYSWVLSSFVHPRRSRVFHLRFLRIHCSCIVTSQNGRLSVIVHITFKWPLRKSS